MKNYASYAPTVAMPAVKPSERKSGMYDAIKIIKEHALTTNNVFEVRVLLTVARRIEDALEKSA